MPSPFGTPPWGPSALKIGAQHRTAIRGIQGRPTIYGKGTAPDDVVAIGNRGIRGYLSACESIEVPRRTHVNGVPRDRRSGHNILTQLVARKHFQSLAGCRDHR